MNLFRLHFKWFVINIVIYNNWIWLFRLQHWKDNDLFQIPNLLIYFLLSEFLTFGTTTVIIINIIMFIDIFIIIIGSNVIMVKAGENLCKFGESLLTLHQDLFQWCAFIFLMLQVCYISWLHILKTIIIKYKINDCVLTPVLWYIVH